MHSDNQKSIQQGNIQIGRWKKVSVNTKSVSLMAHHPQKAGCCDGQKHEKTVCEAGGRRRCVTAVNFVAETEDFEVGIRYFVDLFH